MQKKVPVKIIENDYISAEGKRIKGSSYYTYNWVTENKNEKENEKILE